MAANNILSIQMDRSNPEHLLLAVARVFERYRSEGRKPSSDHWILDEETYRPMMLRAVFMEWATIVGDDKYFPFSDSNVCRFWAAWRRQDKAAITEACEALGVEYCNRSGDEADEYESKDELANSGS